MAPNKLNINEKLTDGEIDLSMSDLQDVPVKEIATYKKAYALDLSNNRLTTLPNNFPTLTHITKLDLSKNELKELPDNFGNLSKLKYLDLYHNQLKHLPLSFSKLKDLRWLDLKDNPLVPTVAKIAGPCLDTKQCQVCAKEVINFFVQLQEQVDNELDLRQKQRQKQIEKNQQKKQEEKKNKKKEKNKIKKQTTSTAYLDEHINTSNTKKKYKSSSNVNSSTYSFSIWKWIFSGLIFSLFIVFCGISVNASWSTHLADIIKIGYLRFTQSLPEYLVPYTIQFENVVKTANVKTGEFLMEYSVVFKLITDKVIRYTHSIKEFVTNNVLSLL